MRTIREQTTVVRQLLQEQLAAGKNFEVECLQSTLVVLTKEAVRPGLGTVAPASELPTSPTLYKQFEALYCTWHKQKVQLTAKMDGAEGMALKSIIDYLRDNSRTQDDAGALASWEYLLQHWDKLPAFLQKQTTLKAISKCLSEIITTIRQAQQPKARQWPNDYNHTFARNLSPEELTAYRTHLRGLGWRYDGTRQIWVAPA